MQQASFLLIQLWRASVCKASKSFSLQQWTSWMILNQAFFFFFLHCPAELQDHGKALFWNKHRTPTVYLQYSLHTKKHLFTDYRPNYWGGNSVFFGSKQERLGLLFGTNAVVNSTELLSSPGSQRNVKGWACSGRASNESCEMTENKY